MKKTTFLKQNIDLTIQYISVYYLFAFLSFLFFSFFPLKILGLILIAGITISGITTLIRETDKLLYANVLNIVLSALALIYKWQWGFAMLGIHLENYYCWIIFSFSVLACLTRLIRLTVGKKHVKQETR